MQKKQVFWLLIAFTNLICISGYSQTSGAIIGQKKGNPIITAVPFLTITPDARAAGMGDAGVAIPTDANGSYWNPAKTVFNTYQFGAAVSYTPWLQKIVGDMNLAYLSTYRKWNKIHAFSAAMRYFDLGTMDFTNYTGGLIRSFNPREFTFELNHAMLLSERLSIGYNARYIHSNIAGTVSVNAIDARPGNTASVDLGVYFQNPEMTLGGLPTTVALGANLSNIGFKISYTDTRSRDFIPTNLRLGTAITSEFDEFNKLMFALDVNKLLVPSPPIIGLDSLNRPVIVKGQDPRNKSLLSGMFGSFNDAPNGFSEELREFYFATGVEYWYNDIFAARGGYFYENRYKGNRQYFTLGVGLRYQKFGIDFAYLIATQRQHPLEDTLRFTLLFNLSKDESTSSKKTKKVKSDDIGI
ncbi:MAG: type IX secretion system outer membrane channel protein PorV [Flammeovirgaceae bacterium]|nr:type IX secretion system outer membrane channel protein PorV [Flammeovirgaceae bacterium]MDW8287673.1 type IX secretion system outer membrane channel protein PorV [Flammeovirgaceae bacterium]